MEVPREYHLLTEAKEPVKEALLRPNIELIRFRDPHPCYRGDISFINLDNVSSTLLLPCKSP
jgi:hypothetical protein